jgi:hypothetical protein
LGRDSCASAGAANDSAMAEAISNFEAKFIRFPFVARRISCVKTYRRETHHDQHTFTRRGINFFEAKPRARSRFRNWHVKMVRASEVAERRNSIVGARLSVSGHFGRFECAFDMSALAPIRDPNCCTHGTQ